MKFQLRYTGMLETVRIRRAGYNVRLTYEEFIQHYRILLPKGLLSSQKDVQDFMNHLMDLNRQHYQLGITKIYMRENQKMRLDIKLHTKIIESIISIQRWFRSILQRQKYLHLRQATIVIQSFWRMSLAQKQVHFRRACFHGAAMTIQAAWRMYTARKKYLQIRHSIIFLQAHVRGKLARTKFQQNLKQKHMRERQKLRSTQSLPASEKSLDIVSFQPEPVKRIRTPTPHYSLDADIELCPDTTSNAAQDESPPPPPSSHHRLTKQKRDQMLDQTEQQIRDLLIISKDEQYLSRKSSVPIDVDPFLSYQSTAPTSSDALDLGTKMYDVEKAMRKNSDDLTPPVDSLKRFDITKMPIRRVDSGPSRRDVRYDPKGQISALPRPTPATNVEIVFVNEPSTATSSTSSLSSVSSNTIITSQATLLRSSPYNQQYSLETIPHRRDLVRSEEYHQTYQPPIVYHQPIQQQQQSENISRTSIPSGPPKGKFFSSTSSKVLLCQHFMFKLSLNTE